MDKDIPMVGQSCESFPDVAEWAVAWTKSRAEKVLVEYLSERHVCTYLPLVRKRRVYGRHIRESWLPLFPGYVFYDCGAIAGSELLKSHKVVTILRAQDRGLLRTELRSLWIALSQNPVLHAVPFDIAGARVRVVSGAFKGVEGEFIRRKNQSSIIVKITLLSRAVEMQIDEGLVAVF